MQYDRALKHKNRKRDYSIARITEAYFALLEEHELGSITVVDICKRADMNRSTFYSNFEDIYALNDYLWLDMQQKLHRVIQAYPEVSEWSFYSALFDLFKEKKYQNLLRLLPSEKVADSLSKMVFEVVIEPRLDEVEDKELFLAAHKYAHYGGMGLLQDWLHSDHPLPPESMSHLLCSLAIACVSCVDPESFQGRV